MPHYPPQIEGREEDVILVNVEYVASRIMQGHTGAPHISGQRKCGTSLSRSIQDVKRVIGLHRFTFLHRLSQIIQLIEIEVQPFLHVIVLLLEVSLIDYVLESACLGQRDGIVDLLLK